MGVVRCHPRFLSNRCLPSTLHPLIHPATPCNIYTANNPFMCLLQLAPQWIMLQLAPQWTVFISSLMSMLQLAPQWIVLQLVPQWAIGHQLPYVLVAISPTMDSVATNLCLLQLAPQWTVATNSLMPLLQLAPQWRVLQLTCVCCK